MGHLPETLIPRPAAAEEFGELVRFLDSVFRAGRTQSMQQLFPNLYRPELAGRNLVITDAGRIVHATGVFPIPFRVRAAGAVSRWSLAGLGGVSTFPPYRGKGLMTKGLHAAVERMRAEGLALSALWGDRQRYGHFGWEEAGMCCVAGVTARSLPPEQTARLASWERVAGPADPRLATVADLDGARDTGADRDRAAWQLLSSRLGFDVYLARSRDDEHAAAFLVGLRAPDTPDVGRVTELGGASSLWAPMVRRWMEQEGLTETEIHLDPLLLAAAEELLQYAASARIMPTAMVRVLDLERLLAGYQPVLAARARRFGLSAPLALRLETTDSTAAACIEIDATGALRIGPAAGAGIAASTIRLDRRAMSLFLFGPYRPAWDRLCAGQTVAAPSLLLARALFPLPLFIPEINRV